MKQILVCLVLALCASFTAPALAQDGKGAAPKAKTLKDGREVMVQSHRFRFAVPKSWEVKDAEGIYMVNSPDKKLLMVMVLLDTIDQVPEAMQELDKMVVVTGAKLGEPWNMLQGAIPMQLQAGSGTLQPSGREVELLSVVMNIINKPVVAMFYVHKDASGTMLPKVKETLASFGLLLTPAEVEELRKMKEDFDKKNPKPSK